MLKLSVTFLISSIRLLQKDFAIYVLDDYTVHLIPGIIKVMYQRGNVVFFMGRSITGFVKVFTTASKIATESRK